VQATLIRITVIVLALGLVRKDTVLSINSEPSALLAEMSDGVAQRNIGDLH
jgi:hypothetical protein